MDDSQVTNSQKIEIDKPTSDPVLLEARRAFLASKPKDESQKVVHPFRSSDSEVSSDNDNPLEETFEERAERKRKDKEERKRKKKIEEQKAKRFKRMQAFQARSGMQNFMDEPTLEDTQVDEDDKNDVGDMIEVSNQMLSQEPDSSKENSNISDKTDIENSKSYNDTLDHITTFSIEYLITLSITFFGC